MRLPALYADALNHDGLVHAFFTRQGGVSSGLYASLNGGVGSRDKPADVAENRRRMAEDLGVAPERLLVPFQVHSAEALAVSAPWEADARPHVDGLVTTTPGLAIGVTGADCGMVLLADAEARVVGAVHSGWKGALGGVLDATVATMESRGAVRERIVAVLGPTIAQPSYEVGEEFRIRFLQADAGHERFFAPGTRPGHLQFDLPGFIVARLQGCGVGRAGSLALDTYADEDRFFSFRRATHRREADYGRLVAAIALR